MCIGGCTWQWLQRTVQQPLGQSSLLAPSVSQPQDARHAHAHHILSQHIKHTWRLIRLFRHAISKQTLVTSGGSPAMHGSDLPAQMPAAVPRMCNSIGEELEASSHSAFSSAAASSCAPCVSCQSEAAAAAALDPAAAQASSALRGAAEAAVTASTVEHTMSASTQAEDASAAAGHHSSSAPHSDSMNKAALFVGAKPSAQTTILVQAVIPDQQLCTNSCHTPCLLNFSVAPQTLASHCSGGTLQTNASTAVPEGIEAQRDIAKKLVQQHLQGTDSGWNGSAPIQLSSSVKVSHLCCAHDAALVQFSKCKSPGVAKLHQHVYA